jgi:hypothetical protein
MSEQGLLRRLISETESEMDTLAHQVAAEGAPERAYLVKVGRYRALKGVVIKLRTLLETDRDEEPDDEPETVTLQTAQPRPLRRRHKARNWGGT